MSSNRNSTNIPVQGEINLDHTGHFVTDVGQATAVLTAAGFKVTPVSMQVQPDPQTGAMNLTGTGNVCVMLRQGYLEFLYHTADTPLGREFKIALNRRAGLHLVAFGHCDSAARHEELSATGRQMRPLVRMSREIGTVDGSQEAHFVVARLADGAMPEGRVQMVTHKNDSALWQPRWLDHPNGALALRAMVISAPDPDDAAARFATFLDRPAHRHEDGTYGIALERGALEFMTEEMATAVVGRQVEPERAAFAACRLGVNDIAATRAYFEISGLSFSSEGDCLTVPFPAALGVGAWIFEGPPEIPIPT